MTAAPSLPEIKIDAHASAAEARAFLERDRLMAAYALADIDQPEIEAPAGGSLVGTARSRRS